MDGTVTIIGHGGGDSGVSAMLTRHLAAGHHALGRLQPGPRLVGGHEAPREAFGLSEPRD